MKSGPELIHIALAVGESTALRSGTHHIHNLAVGSKAYLIHKVRSGTNQSSYAFRLRRSNKGIK